MYVCTCTPLGPTNNIQKERDERNSEKRTYHTSKIIANKTKQNLRTGTLVCMYNTYVHRYIIFSDSVAAFWLIKNQATKLETKPDRGQKTKGFILSGDRGPQRKKNLLYCTCTCMYCTPGIAERGLWSYIT